MIEPWFAAMSLYRKMKSMFRRTDHDFIKKLPTRHRKIKSLAKIDDGHKIEGIAISR